MAAYIITKHNNEILSIVGIVDYCYSTVLRLLLLLSTFPLKNNPKKPKICIFEKINQAVKTLSNWPGNQKRKHNLLHVRNVVV